MTTLVQAEMKKVLTLRTWWALALTPVVIAFLSGSITRPLVQSIADSADASFDVNLASTAIVLGGSSVVALVFATIFGAVTVANEFTHKTLTTTFLTAHGRDGVIAAKLGVIAAFAVGYALAVQVVGIGAMFLFNRDFGFTTDLFAICGAGILACALWALIGAGFTLLTGSAMAGVLSVTLWFLFGEWILRALLGAVGADGIGTALPGSAAIGTIVNAGPSVELDWFTAWPSAPMILVAWVVLFAGAGWLRIRTRDIT